MSIVSSIDMIFDVIINVMCTKNDKICFIRISSILKNVNSIVTKNKNIALNQQKISAFDVI